MNPLVLDTNVPVVANGKHPIAGDACVLACIRALRDTRTRLVLVDDQQRIFTQYRRHLSHSGQPGAGDAFFKWLWDNQANVKRCRKVPVTPIGGSETDFEEYPIDPDLSGFHADDRIFVAVARASGDNPDILNASDTDWWVLRDAFERNGVSIRFLCPELMAIEE